MASRFVSHLGPRWIVVAALSAWAAISVTMLAVWGAELALQATALYRLSEDRGLDSR